MHLRCEFANRAIRIGDWKLVSAGRNGPWELYDLAADRCESNDLSGQHPAKARDLSDAWQRHETRFRQMAASDEWPDEAPKDG